MKERFLIAWQLDFALLSNCIESEGAERATSEGDSVRSQELKAAFNKDK